MNVAKHYSKLASQGKLYGKNKNKPSDLYSAGTRKSKKQIRRAKKEFNSFYESRGWLEVRYKALIKHGRRCMCCGATPKDGAILQVDHIKPRSYYPELSLSLDNLQVLCKSCNSGKSNKHFDDFRAEK